MPLNPLFGSGPVDADGTPQVSPEPTSLLVDDYSQAITTYHTTGGTAPSITGGYGQTNEGTTASATSYLRSTLAYNLRAATYLRIAHIVTIEASATANNTRWWGYGQNQSTPTAANPVLNGAVWLLDSANGGALSAAIFSNGTKTIIPWSTAPTRDSSPHRYQIDYRQSIIYWSVDGVVVASRAMPQLAVATNNMYEIWGAANTSTAPAAHTFQVSSSSVADMGGNNRTISDGVNPGLQATVKVGSTAVATADSPLVVALHPSTNTPAVQGGFIGIGAATPNGSFTVSTTTNTATVLKTSAGNLQALLIANTSGSTQYVKLYNATAVTLGTTVAVVDVPVAAGATLTLNLGANGLRFSTGIAYAVTGAAGTTNNTAGAGGVSVATTYV